MGGGSISNSVRGTVYVVDTHALVWFIKGDSQLGLAALLAMLSERAQIVVPTFVLQEISQKFGPNMRGPKDMHIPPTPVLRLLGKCANVRMLDRGAVVLAKEFQLKRDRRLNGVPASDTAIAAAALVVREYYDGEVCLITADGSLTKWASKLGIGIVWKQRISTSIEPGSESQDSPRPSRTSGSNVGTCRRGLRI